MIYTSTVMNRKRLLFLALFYCLMFLDILVAQSSRVDSLERLLSGYQVDDTVKVNWLNQIAAAVFQSDSSKAIGNATQAMLLSNRLNFNKGKAESFWVLGKAVSYHRSDSLALDYFKNAVAVAEASGDQPALMKYLTSLGLTYSSVGSIDSAKACHEKGHQLSVRLGNQPAMIRFLGNLCVLYTGQGHYEKALEGYRHLLKVCQEIGERKSEASTLNNIGSIYQYLGLYPKAQDYFFESLKIREMMDDGMGTVNSLCNIGSVMSKQGNYTKALEYFERALVIAMELQDKRKIADCYENMGELYLFTKQPVALDYLQKAWDIVDGLSYTTPMVTVSIKMGDYYLSVGQPDQALSFYSRAMDLSRRMKRNRTICQIWLKMGAIYMRQGDYQNSLNHSLNSLGIADNLNLLNDQKDAHQQLSDLYASLGDFKSAYQHQKIFKNLNDSIYNEKNVLQMAEVEYAFRFEKEKQLLELEQQKREAIRNAEEKFQLTVIALLIGAFLLVSTLAIFIYRSYRIKHFNNRLLVAHKNEILEKNNQLQELIATKDKFFSIIAHDLRGSFNSILGFSDLLVLGGDENSKEEMLTFGQSIRTSAQTTHKLLENLLEWSMASLGLIGFNPNLLSLKYFMDANKDAWCVQAAVKGIRVDFLGCDSISVLADPDMLSTILRNLIANAIKFTPRGGRILIEATTVAHWVEISVKDNGVGMNEGVVRELFSVKGSVSMPGTEKEKGTGLGLLLCKEFVARHKGTIRVVSAIGAGSTFTVLFPANTSVDGDGSVRRKLNAAAQA